MLPHLESNERFEYVVSATEDVNKKLSKSRINLIRYTLTALNPNVSEDQPVILETNEALRKHWKTIRVNIPDVPRQICRAIIWEALNRQSKDDTAAAIIWLTAGSLLQHLALDADERELLTEFLLSLRDKMEQRAVADWQNTQLTTSAIEIPQQDLSRIKAAPGNNDSLNEGLIKACGPNDADVNVIDGANPYSPSTNATNTAFRKMIIDRCRFDHKVNLFDHKMITSPSLTLLRSSAY